MARRDIDRLQGEIEELFADLWQVPRFAAGTRLVHRPQIDVVRTDDPPELTVVVEIPGADVDSIGVVVDGRRLVVTGERPRPRAGDQVWYRSEIEYGPFEREVSLAVDGDAGGAGATYERGLLKVVLPVAERAPTPARLTIAIRRIA